MRKLPKIVKIVMKKMFAIKLRNVGFSQYFSENILLGMTENITTLARIGTVCTVCSIMRKIL
jgi:hypothetical protein